MLGVSDLDELVSQNLKTILDTKIIYQYSSLNTSINIILKNKTLRFSNPKNFNDPFDCNENLLKIKINPNNINRHLNDISDKSLSRQKRREMTKRLSNPKTIVQMFKKKKKEYKVSCFSKLSDEVLMWSHYADKHKGVCIGYDFPYKYEEKFILCPVNYFDKIEPLDGESDTKKVFLHWLTSKSKRWEYEEEIRAISISKSEEDYENISFDKKRIREIIFGCNVSELEIEAAIKELEQGDLILNDIILKKMSIDPNTFLLRETIL